MLKKSERWGLRTWIELNKKALKNNYLEFRRILGDTKLCAVVKSNAYGHGLVDFSREIVSCGVDYLAVDSITEALKLREEKIKIPILVLGYTLPEMFEMASKKNIEITISSLESLRVVMKLPYKIKIHLKIDTGMHRQGFLTEDMDECLKLLSLAKNIKIVGVYTHFAKAKNPAFSESVISQLNIFNLWVEKLKKAGFVFLVHASATASGLIFKEARFDMVRVGIGLYGFWPSLEVKNYTKRQIKLKPVLSWRTIVSEIKKIKKGESVGYDFVENLNRDSLIGICPIGYWHGFPRNLSSVGEVLVSGKRARVLGRVSMDMIVIDLTNINTKVGDVVTIIGEDGLESIGPEEIANIAEQSYYELITRINPLIKKILV